MSEIPDEVPVEWVPVTALVSVLAVLIVWVLSGPETAMWFALIGGVSTIGAGFVLHYRDITSTGIERWEGDK